MSAPVTRRKKVETSEATTATPLKETASKLPPEKAGTQGTMKTSITVKRPSYNFGEQFEESTTERNQTVEVPVINSPPAYVRVSASVTKNMGNFNSIKVQVDVSLPCYPEGTEIDRTYDICSSWVNQKIQDEIEYAYGREETPVAQ